MTKWPCRMRSNLALALNALSVLIGIAICLIQCPDKWYVLVLCAGPFFLLLAFYPRRRNVPDLLTKQFLTDPLADSVLAAAVKPDQFPVCIHLGVSRACGVAVASITALETVTGIRHFCDTLNVRAGEMLEELIFTESVLKKHLARVRRAHVLVSSLVRNVSGQCFRLWPTGQSIYNELASIENYLEEEAVRPMEVMLERIRTAANPEDEINLLITNTVPRALLRLIQAYKLPSIVARSQAVLEKLRQDWRHRVQQIWDLDSCRPQAANPPAQPEIVADFLASGA